MKISKLIDKMKCNGVSLPSNGSGMGGRVISRDLEHALGTHFLRSKYANNHSRKLHCELRRTIRPMKAFRYNELSDGMKRTVFEDNEWIAEEKFNGWRILITYIPGHGVAFWGSNLSDVDFLPVDYTDHINCIIDVSRVTTGAAIIDTEVLCHASVETKLGRLSQNTLEAVGAVLGSLPNQAKKLQRNGAVLEFMAFDYITSPGAHCTTPYAYRHVPEDLITALTLSGVSIRPVVRKNCNKKQYLNEIWKAGGEGIILKHVDKPYVSGGRLATHAIKVKRTMSGEIGDDLDAFISGFVLTPEWTKAKLVGGIKLSVYIDGSVHEIATVTSMPKDVRVLLTYSDGNEIGLNKDFLGSVLVVDGQELSNLNRRIMHARVDWSRGFRADKPAEECTL